MPNFFSARFDQAVIGLVLASLSTAGNSQVISDQGTTLVAQNNITIEAATNTTSEHSFRDSKTSGVFSSGGAGFTVGKQQQSLNQQGTSTTAAASTVGSIAGNTTMAAGGQYRQTGSDVVAPKGDISIAAQNIQIQEARETGSQSTEQKFKQSGLTVAVGNPVISAIQTANQMQQAAGNTSNGRMQALAAANAGLAVKDAMSAIQAGQQTQGASTADKLGGISVSVSLGSSKSQSSSASQSNTARGSTVQAGGNVTIVASHANSSTVNNTNNSPPLSADITVKGSIINADGAANINTSTSRLNPAINPTSSPSNNYYFNSF